MPWNFYQSMQLLLIRNLYVSEIKLDLNVIVRIVLKPEIKDYIFNLINLSHQSVLGLFDLKGFHQNLIILVQWKTNNFSRSTDFH